MFTARYVLHSTFCQHSVFVHVVWISEQTAIISLYSINWLVFINERECVYCAVRTGSLYTASLTFSNSTFCPHSVFVCFVWIWEHTMLISLYSINRLVCITQAALHIVQQCNSASIQQFVKKCSICGPCIFTLSAPWNSWKWSNF